MVGEKGPVMPWSLHVRQGWTLVWLDYPNHDHPVAWGSRGSAAGIIRWIMDEIICRSCIPGYLSMSVHAVSLSMDMHSEPMAYRALFQYKEHLFRHGIPIIKMMQWWDHLIFIMGICMLSYQYRDSHYRDNDSHEIISWDCLVFIMEIFPLNWNIIIWNFHHWLHIKSPKWQLMVQPVIWIPSNYDISISFQIVNVAPVYWNNHPVTTKPWIDRLGARDQSVPGVPTRWEIIPHTWACAAEGCEAEDWTLSDFWCGLQRAVTVL